MARILCLVFLAFFHGYLSAATYPATITYATNHTSTSYATLEEAKSAAATARKNVLIAGNPSAWVWTLTYIKFTAPHPQYDTFLMRHNYMRPDGVGSVADATLTISYNASCPVGATVVNSTTPRTATCTDTCVSPQTMVNGVCGDNQCQALKGIAITSLTHNTATRTLCHNSCTVKTGFQICTNSPVKCSSNGNFTGASCAPPLEPTVPATTEHDCVTKGQSFGTVNGLVVCTKAGTPNTPPLQTTAEATKTVANPTTGATNTTTTTTTNNTANNTVTTKTTGTDANGNAVDEEVTQDGTSFCESNPNSKLCEGEDDESNFGGACGGFTCDGDAIQCAIAKKQHQSRCDDLSEDSTTELGGQLLNGTAPLGGTDTLSNPLEVAVGSLNDDSFLSKECPQDMQVNMGSHVINVPFSQLCGGLQIAGKIVLAFAYLIAITIIFR